VNVRVRADGDRMLCLVNGCTYTSWYGETFLGEIKGFKCGKGESSKLFLN